MRLILIIFILNQVAQVKKHNEINNTADIIYIDVHDKYRQIRKSTLAGGRWLREKYLSSSMSTNIFANIFSCSY